MALSPDGKQLVYVATSGAGALQLYLRSLDSFEARAIPGTEGAIEPFFSPDSQWVGFFASGMLKKVSIKGGPTVTLCDAFKPRGATWGSNDTIVFAPTVISGLFVVPAAGGTPQPLTTPDGKKGETSHRWPEFLPGGKEVLFVATTSLADSDVGADAPIKLYDLKTGQRRDLLLSGGHPRYTPTGHLLYAQEGTLMAVPFDPVRLEVTGAPTPVVEGIMRGVAGGALYSFSDNGALVYIPGGIQAVERGLYWVDRKGAGQL